MLNINVEYSSNKINYLQIGYEDKDNLFSGIVIDMTEILFINNNIRVIDKDGKEKRYEDILNKIINKLEELTIYLCPIEEIYKIKDMDIFKSKYIKHFFNDDIIWLDSSNDILELTQNKKNEYYFLLSMLEKIDKEEYIKIKGNNGK